MKEEAKRNKKAVHRKDDRMMHLMYECPESFLDSVTTPMDTSPNFFMRFCSDWLYECAQKIWNV